MNGFEVVPAESNEQSANIVYSRTYKRAGRSNNPLELIMEFGSQSLIDSCFPKPTERFHVEMFKNKVRFSPLANRTFNIINRFKNADPFSAMVALTGGVDIYAMERLGWKANIVLEHRPQEARDIASGRNLTEVNALNTWVNANPRVILNEDIHKLSTERLAIILATQPPVAICSYSIGCDDHSLAKSKKAKQVSLDDLSTMLDMIYPVLKQIEMIEPLIVLLENVKGFGSSDAGKIMSTTLRRFGYHVSEMVLSGKDYAAYQARERYYMVASVFPGYKAPPAVNTPAGSLWEIVEKHLADCVDVTDTKLIKSREGYHRKMPAYITRDSLFSPTVLKSQDRIRDGVFIEDGGRVYKPSIPLLKDLMSIPQSFNVEWMAKEQATETLGQSVDFVLHQAVIKSVNEHLNIHIGSHSLVSYGIK
ncbi:DNA cytosine methyltransferase [Cellvibrio sp. QJXJ]|uniref:DNA cytosine methyltransferase n=1 Tax=Cellvibrio sp. QJXJ TaxID=2964606 RepID=UPI0021C35A71|nr:DNA cytosine methyltransferase [Cellvibrio sp. QJXJ]UUA75178.1 DNA cytosine methyltransferase [Cellvibrio sp. QJXJ]